MRITELQFCSFIYFLLSQLSQGDPVLPPADAIIIQIQHSGVVGGNYVAERVLLNGVPLSSTSQEVSNILQSLSNKELLLFSASISQMPALKGHIIVCHQECILEGHQLHWTDRVFYNGTVYLSLEPNGTWTALVAQAMVLKGILEPNGHHTESESTRLQNGCMQLMKELKFSDKPSGSGIFFIQIIIPVFVVFAVMFTLSILVSRSQGWTYPGGVIASIIHYPKNLSNTDPYTNDYGYSTL
ncbi:uncharacterized protein LOC111949102 isoform X2 [Oryzias latipes]|uniref:uncharacterized protein LOC111949102 isoform X2 n=1 Tax=Oryzias latipes TaxID=8090 RepID=UPI000CE2806B|nr:uncharacterized protein LOC111949102 isoform X2 [Oryzias latipes]